MSQCTLEKHQSQGYSAAVAMTLDQIVEETRRWPREQLGELLDRLALELHEADEPQIQSAWRQELRRRLAKIETGELQGIPGEEVSARVRRIVGR